MSDFTVNELAARLAADDDQPPKVQAEVAPFGQVAQTLFSLCAAPDPRPDFVVVWTRPEEAVPAFGERLRGEEVPVDRLLQAVDAFAELIEANTHAGRFLFVASWTMPAYVRGLGMLDMRGGLGTARR